MRSIRFLMGLHGCAGWSRQTLRRCEVVKMLSLEPQPSISKHLAQSDLVKGILNV